MAPSSDFWVTCALDPWPSLEADDAFADVVALLRSDGECEFEGAILTLEEAAPSFVPTGSIVLHVTGDESVVWDAVMELLDAIAAAGDGAVFADDRQVVLDRRSQKPNAKAFREDAPWAVAFATRRAVRHVVVEGEAVADPRRELARVGLGALSNRVIVTSSDGGLRIVGDAITDVLVAGQVLAIAARGRAFAVDDQGTREELPR